MYVSVRLRYVGCRIVKITSFKMLRYSIFILVLATVERTSRAIAWCQPLFACQWSYDMITSTGRIRARLQSLCKAWESLCKARASLCKDRKSPCKARKSPCSGWKSVQACASSCKARKKILATDIHQRNHVLGVEYALTMKHMYQ